MSDQGLHTLTDENLVRVLRLSAGPHLDHGLWWRRGHYQAPVEDQALRVFVDCSDFFFWGSADCEELGDDDVELLQQTFDDVAGAVGPGWDGADPYLLYCARRRAERPQGACYPHLHSATWPLFDAAGPGREAGLGNPHRHPSERSGVAGAEARARAHDPETPVLPSPGVAVFNGTLAIADVRRVLEEFSFDYCDHVRWIVDADGHLRLFVVTFGAFNDAEVGCEAAEVTPDNVDDLLSSIEQTKVSHHRMLVDEHVAASFISSERGLEVSTKHVERARNLEAMVKNS